MRLGSFVAAITITLASCAQLEGLDHFANVDGLTDAITLPDAATRQGDPAPVTTGTAPTPPGDSGTTNDGGGTSSEGGSDPDSGQPPPPPPPPLPPSDLAPTGTGTWGDGINPAPQPAPALNDGNDGTDFTLGAGTCLAPLQESCGTGGANVASAPWIQVAFPAPVTIAHVVILGSRDRALSTMHVTTAQLMVINADTSTPTTNLTMSEPYGDADVTVGPYPNAVAIRILLLTANGATPSFGEIKIYAQ